MMSFLAVIFMITIVTLFLYQVTIGISYSTHKDMVRTCTRTYGYGTFEDFKREFSKVDWKFKTSFSDSLFDDDNNNKLHASIIEFGGKGMMMSNSIEYLKVRLFMAEAVKKYKSNNLVNWSNYQKMEVDKIDLQKKIK